jgi:hypothetical protein
VGAKSASGGGALEAAPRLDGAETGEAEVEWGLAAGFDVIAACSATVGGREPTSEARRRTEEGPALKPLHPASLLA